MIEEQKHEMQNKLCCTEMSSTKLPPLMAIGFLQAGTEVQWR